jgi:hypothetical protein
VHSQSRALKLELNLKHMTADVADQDEHSPPLLASFEGNDQQLPNQDDFVGWGQQPYFSEYNAKGKLVFDGRFVDDNLTYRAYRLPWSGTPATPPAIATSHRGKTMTVYVSWNGATTATGWRVFAGNTTTKMPTVAQAPKRGFETAIKAPTRKFVYVQALDAKGHPLSQSATEPVN